MARLAGRERAQAAVWWRQPPVTLIIIVAAALSYGGAATGGDAVAAFEGGLRAKDAGMLDEAAKLFWVSILGGYQPLEQAMAHFQDCYARKGVPEEAMLFVAKEYYRRGDAASGERFVDRALEIKADCAEAYLLRGMVAQDPGSAVRNYYEAVRLAPDNGEYYYTLGTKLFELNKNDEALVCFENASRLRPDLNLAFGNLVYLKTRVCEWGSITDRRGGGGEKGGGQSHSSLMKKLLRLARRELRDGKPGDPFFIDSHQTLAYPFPPAIKLEIARRHAQHELAEAVAAGNVVSHHNPASFPPTVLDSQEDGAISGDGGPWRDRNRIRVGYVSADFKLKATSYLIRDMFRYHDRARFEVFCFATTGNSEDALRTEFGLDWRGDIQEGLEPNHLVDVAGKPLAEVVRLIRDVYKIHILVNMDGYSNKGIRLEGVFPLQPAPIQVSMLVYVGTIGGDFIQYIVTDPVASPPQLEGIYTEKFLLLPQSFFINSHSSIRELSRPARQLPRRLQRWFKSLPPAVPKTDGGGSTALSHSNGRGPRTASQAAVGVGPEDDGDGDGGGTSMVMQWMSSALGVLGLGLSAGDTSHPLGATEPGVIAVRTVKEATAHKAGSRVATKAPPKVVSFTFCNLNRHLKIRPRIFDIWMKVLKQIPGARLLMLEFPAESAPRLRKRAESRGVDGKRIELLKFIGHPYQHQKRIGKLCDAVLDNDIYNAHTMAVDTLWSGVPLLTWALGKDMGGRVGNSILTTLGLPELIAPNASMYEATALRLAHDRAFHADLRRRLVLSTMGQRERPEPYGGSLASPCASGGSGGDQDPAGRATCKVSVENDGGGNVNEAGHPRRKMNPFWDTGRYVRHLEEGFALAWRNFRAGAAPRHLRVPEMAWDTTAQRWTAATTR